ncbi:hypothetical protein [Streptomyces sp. NPDC020983]|uniref:hypothetical protein n=1 Tax=Streptomyces sp. NPDC020983 TaxID=3365106 RepID=UPI0037B6B9A3
MTLYDTLASLWRTVVPMIVGALVAALAHAGIGVDSAAATVWLGSAFGAAYYAFFRVLEAHVSSRWGWLLGLARPPQYPAKATPAPAVVPPSAMPGA